MLIDSRDILEAIGELCTSDQNQSAWVILRNESRDESMGNAKTREAAIEIVCHYMNFTRANKGTVLTVEGFNYRVQSTRVEADRKIMECTRL